MSNLNMGCRAGAGLVPEHLKLAQAQALLPPILRTQKCACTKESFLEGWGSELSGVRAHQVRTKEANLKVNFIPTA